MMIRMYLIISSLSKWIKSDGANRVKMFQIEDWVAKRYR